MSIRAQISIMRHLDEHIISDIFSYQRIYLIESPLAHDAKSISKQAGTSSAVAIIFSLHYIY